MCDTVLLLLAGGVQVEVVPEDAHSSDAAAAPTITVTAFVMYALVLAVLYIAGKVMFGDMLRDMQQQRP